MTVQHFLACENVRVISPVRPWNWYNLDGVGHRHTVALSTELPCVIPVMNLNTRFYHGRGSVDFELRIWGLNGPNGRELIEVYGPQTVFFRPNEPTRDFVFLLNRIAIPYPGLYAVRLASLPGDRGRGVTLATEYFEVVNVP